MEYTNDQLEATKAIIESAYKKSKIPEFHDLMSAYDSFMRKYQHFIFFRDQKLFQTLDGSCC